MTKIPSKNIEPGSDKSIKTGEGNFLYCDYSDPSTNRCSFHIYRIDGKSLLGNKTEWILLGKKYSSMEMLRSDNLFAPRFSWFEEEEEEIKVAFDVLLHKSSRISCKDHVLVLKKGDFEINLYWDEEKNKKNKNHSVRLFAEFTETAPLTRGNKVSFDLNVKYLEKMLGDKVFETMSISEESRSKKGKITIVKSKEIKLNYFHESFCAPKILGQLDQGFKKNAEDKIDIQEIKSFKRGYYYEPEEVLSFLRKKKLIPEDVFYDGIVSNGEAYDKFNKVKETIEGIISFFKSVTGFAKDFAKGYVDKFMKWTYQKWRENNYSYRFYREEYTKTLLYFNGINNKNKKIRKKQFDEWFVSHYGTYPKDPEFIELKTTAERKLKEFNSKDLDWRGDNYMIALNLKRELKSYDVIEKRYEHNLFKFEKLEKSTTSFLEIGSERSPYTMF